MTPNDVAADPVALHRFQHEVAYFDRPPVFDAAVDAETEVLRKDGVSVVAWLWPHAMYESDFDPFDQTRPIEEQRKWQRRIPARRFAKIIDSIAEATGRTDTDVKVHLEWAGPVTEFELDQLLTGAMPFPFQTIVRLREALDLEFTAQWELLDAAALTERIDQSVIAASIARRMRAMSSEGLESLAGKLPRAQSADAVGGGPAVPAPAAKDRYASLFEALRSDVRNDPTYKLDEIDRVLMGAGEAPLPASARSHRAWWSGTKTEGRPQVGAWLAAGFRVDGVLSDQSNQSVSESGGAGKLVEVRFVGLPGRAQWLASRTEGEAFRVPLAERVPIYPFTAAMQWDGPARKKVVDALRLIVEVGRSTRPEDEDVRHLLALLDREEFVDRSQIERHLSEVSGEPVDASWLTNLLTRARRQNWAANVGTRSQPKWVPVRSKALIVENIAEVLNLDAPELGPGATVRADFFLAVAAAVGVDTAGMRGPQAVRAVVEAKGREWRHEFESTGGTVTVAGLEALRDAVHLDEHGGRSWVWREEWDES